MRFIAGFVAGIIMTFFFIMVIANSDNDNEVISPDETITGLTIFPEKAECITKNDLEILQTLKPNMALAQFGDYLDKTTVLLINYDGKSYYDKQKIQVPSKSCARQIGTYMYSLTMGLPRTVPAVIIE